MNERISVDTNTHFGKPTIAGTRITVQDVLELIDHGLSFEEIKTDYFPDISNDEIQECISYGK